MSRALAAAPVAALAFVATLALAAVAVRHGIVADDTMRLWAGAGTAADGTVPIGRIVAGYPTLPFLTTTLVAWLAPDGAPAPALAAAALFALLAAFCFLSCRAAGFSHAVAAMVTLLIAFHPAVLRAVVAGPADMFLAAFLLMLCLSLYDLRARSGTAEVMCVGLALMGLAFSHPVGAALAFAAVPFLAFAVEPRLVASSALNVVVALVFPTVFMIGAFAYVSWVFLGDGWSFFASPAQSLSLWTVAMARAFGSGMAGLLVLGAGVATALALLLGAPVAAVMLTLVRRRRPLVAPAAVFAATAITASALCIVSGFFGEPSAVAVAAPVLAATVVLRVPAVRERAGLDIALLLLGWFGGALGVAMIDPIGVNRLEAVLERGAGDELDAVAAGGASVGHEGVLADTGNAPGFVLGRGRARGILGPDSESFVLAMLFARIVTPYVAVPDPQSTAGINDRLDKAFPSLFRGGLRGYRVIYQNNTWRLYARDGKLSVAK